MKKETWNTTANWTVATNPNTRFTAHHVVRVPQVSSRYFMLIVKHKPGPIYPVFTIYCQ